MLTIQITSKVEWAAVKQLINPPALDQFPYGESFKANIAGCEGVFYYSGPTKTLAAGACQYAIDRWSPELVLVMGTCGGVAAELQLFDIILAEQTAQWDVDPARKRNNIFHEMLSLDTAWINPNEFPRPIFKGLIASGDQTVSASQCRLLRERQVTAADWETASIAKICSLNDVRCCIVRGVSDLASAPEFDFEKFKRNAPVVMKMLIESYLPVLIRQHIDLEANLN